MFVYEKTKSVYEKANPVCRKAMSVCFKATLLCLKRDLLRGKAAGEPPAVIAFFFIGLLLGTDRTVLSATGFRFHSTSYGFWGRTGNSTCSGSSWVCPGLSPEFITEGHGCGRISFRCRYDDLREPVLEIPSI